MRQLFIKQNQQNNQRLTVRDTRGQILYLIEGRWGRKDDIVSLQTIHGKECLQAKQVKLSPLPIFEVTAQNEDIGVIRKHPGLFGIRDSYFTLHPHHWVITGDFEELYFTAYNNNDLIMECEKIQRNSSDYFELIVEQDDDIQLCSLITVLLDHYARKKKEEEQADCPADDAYNLGFMNNIYFSIPYPQEKLPMIKMK
ncbi:MAG TPA: hypothetical protein H9808_07440 [Candidatus Atopostipes pullistercoris]|uniref:Uncharacterized protein n=1 Tax=Candidatus Atopostipes pullistercoris TaxID=2838467 RepID=A0A9D2G3L6_9LACT|nr:hypothetical protein [Candidatus Atopostipes pullistercoris]